MATATKVKVQAPVLVNTVANTKTKLVWKGSKKKVNMALINDPLSKTKSQLVNHTVIDHTNELMANGKIRKVVDFYHANDITFDVNHIPKSEKHKLRDYLTPEMVQRLLDHPHCVNILTNFDPRLLSPIYVVRLNGDVVLHVFDSMHTLSIVSLLALNGLWGNDPAEWLDFEYPGWIIDTTDESFSMVAALYRNGAGSKPWGPYDHHRVYVRSFDFYGQVGPNNAYELAYQKQQIMVRENATPLPKGHPDLGMEGTLSHIEAAAEFKSNEMNVFEFIMTMNNKYWNGSNDAQMFGFYENLYKGFTSVNQPVSGKQFDKFMDEIHAIIKTLFVSMAELRLATGATYKAWLALQNKNSGTPPFNCALSIVLKIYKRVGGTHAVPSDVNLFVYQPSPNVKIDIYDSLPLSIRQNVSNCTL